jgi:tetratricopeptide (TPR) repeat protein
MGALIRNLAILSAGVVLPLCWVAAAFLPLTAAAQQGVSSNHPAGDIQRLGTIDFPTSCSRQVGSTFNEAIALLASFQYDFSRKVFAEVAQKDPQCAMAFWGEAMSLYHQLWTGPNAKTLQEGLADIRMAQGLAVKTQRESLYIQAAATYYQDDPKMEGEARASAYSAAMAELHRRFPQDINATAFYALSLIAVRDVNQAENLRRRMDAIALLNRLYQQEPNNPAVTHYLIHATDTPELAHLGLKAARQYAKIAPDAPHALHMPSHIFTELGMWQDSIQSNLASISAAEKTTQSLIDNESADQIHALSFLEYAYLQTGRDKQAQHTIEELNAVPGAAADDIGNYQTMLRAMYLEETHRWKEAATFDPQSGNYPMMQVQAYEVRAIGEARTGNLAGARTDIENLRKAFQAMPRAMTGMRHDAQGPEGGLDELAAQAWLAFAEGNSELAFAKMNEAAKRGGSSFRVDGVPGVPMNEMLGDLMLELHRPSEALAAYLSVLKVSPNRFNSLYGAGRAAHLAGNAAAATQYFAKLRRICGSGADRPELLEEPLSASKR